MGPLLASLNSSQFLKTQPGNKTAALSPGGSCLEGPEVSPRDAACNT